MTITATYSICSNEQNIYIMQFPIHGQIVLERVFVQNYSEKEEQQRHNIDITMSDNSSIDYYIDKDYNVDNSLTYCLNFTANQWLNLIHNRQKLIFDIPKYVGNKREIGYFYAIPKDNNPENIDIDNIELQFIPTQYHKDRLNLQKKSVYNFCFNFEKIIRPNDLYEIKKLLVNNDPDEDIYKTK